MSNIISAIKAELVKNAEPEYKKAQQWFFKEDIKLYGVRVGTVRKIGRDFFKQIEPMNKLTVFKLAEELLKIETQETRIIAFQWASQMKRDYTDTDFNTFSRWLKKYVSNWATCDNLCTDPLGKLIIRYPKLISKTVPWRRSRNRWVRRAAAVSLIKAVRARQNLKEALKAADALLYDQDDMVQKGYGWLLKEASNEYPKEVFDYVMKHKDTMPRTALRYAIEKLPANKKKQAMIK